MEKQIKRERLVLNTTLTRQAYDALRLLARNEASMSAVICRLVMNESRLRSAIRLPHRAAKK